MCLLISVVWKLSLQPISSYQVKQAPTGKRWGNLSIWEIIATVTKTHLMCLNLLIHYNTKKKKKKNFLSPHHLIDHY